jgi:hypothetical protein
MAFRRLPFMTDISMNPEMKRKVHTLAEPDNDYQRCSKKALTLVLAVRSWFDLLLAQHVWLVGWF